MADLSGLGDLVLTVGGDISPFEDALQGIPEVASAAATQIQAAFDAIPSATASVEEGMAALGAATTQAGTEAAGSIETIPPALHDTTEAAGETESKLGELLESGLELAGIALTMEAVKEAILGSLEAFGELQTATVAMTAMTGSAEEVATAMEKIPALANQIGASISSLETAFTKFTRYGVDLQAIPGVLSAIADGAMASGVGFDQAANAWERAANTGALAARSIQNMGLSVADVATAMGMTGATSAQVTAAFKAIQDQSDGTTAATQRLDILLRAMPDSIQGLAASADTVNKAFNELSNTVTDAKENIGSALATLGNGVVLKGLEDAIQAVEIAFLGIINIVAEVADAVKGTVTIMIDAFTAVGQAMVDAFSGNFKQAIVDLQAGGQKIASDWMAMGQKMATDFTNTGAIVSKVWGDMSQSATDSNTKTTAGVKETTDAVTQMNQVLLNAQNAFNVASAALANGTGTLAAYETALKALNTAQMTANNGFENAGTAALIAADAYVKMQIAVANTKTDLNAVLTDIAAGTASWTQYDTALAQLNKDQMAANDGLMNAHTALLVVVDDYQKLGVSTLNAATTLQAAHEALISGAISLTQYDNYLQQLNKDQMAFSGGLQSVQTVVNMADVAFQKLGISSQNASTNLQAVWDQFKAGLPVLQQFIDAANGTATAMTKAAGGVESWQAATLKLTASEASMQLSLDNANTTLGAAQALYEQGAISQGVYQKAVDSQKQALDALTGAHKNVASAAQATTAAQLGLNSAMQAGATQALNNVNVSNDYATSLAIVNGKFVSLGIAYGDTIQQSSGLAGAIQQVNGQLVTMGTDATSGASAVNGIATAMKNVVAAAPGMVSSLQAAAGAAASLGSQLDKSMSAPIGGMNMSLTTGEQITAPYVGNPFMGGTETGSMAQGGLFGFTGQQETSTYDAKGQAAAINAMIAAQQQAAQQTTTAAAALTTAAASQTNAAQTAYDAAKAATIAANTTTTAAQSIVTTNDSISQATLAAADAANVQAMAGQALITAGSTLTAAGATITSASTSLVSAATTLTAAVNTATGNNGASTFTPNTPVIGQLPNVGVNGGMSGGLNPAVYTPGYQATVGGTGPQQAGVNLTVNAPGFITSLMNEFMRQLQSQGLVLRRS
jgi:hypothetical protein